MTWGADDDVTERTMLMLTTSRTRKNLTGLAWTKPEQFYNNECFHANLYCLLGFFHVVVQYDIIYYLGTSVNDGVA
jgi:hypothetical protein